MLRTEATPCVAEVVVAEREAATAFDDELPGVALAVAAAGAAAEAVAVAALADVLVAPRLALLPRAVVVAVTLARLAVLLGALVVERVGRSRGLSLRSRPAKPELVAFGGASALLFEPSRVSFATGRAGVASKVVEVVGALDDFADAGEWLCPRVDAVVCVLA